MSELSTIYDYMRLCGVQSRFENGDSPKVVIPDNKQLSSRLSARLSEPAMLDLTKRLIAIPSENPPGNQYNES
jgi:hypothetical protein